MVSYWTVLETHNDAESVAARNASNQGFEVYLPRFRTPVRAGVRTPKPLYPGYLFAHIVDRWHSLMNTRGVKRVIISGAEPSRLHASFIDTVRAREDELGYVLMDNEIRTVFKPDQIVRGVGGVWTGQVGTFMGMTEKERCKVLFSLLGRAVVADVKVKHLALA